MTQYNITIIKPDQFIHAHAFIEIGKLLYLTLRSLGHTSQLHINHLEPDAINIILGYHYLIAQNQQARTDNPFLKQLTACKKIYYQLEQLSDSEGWYTQERHQLLASAEAIWDYTQQNIDFLHKKGLTNAIHLPIGWHNEMETLQHAPVKDIDVLFYGCLNPRRQKILTELNRHCRLKVLFGVYGEERDHTIARAKIILNIHYYETALLEQVRISYLLNNRCFVLSEVAQPAEMTDLIETVPYKELIARCLYFIHNSAEREASREHSYQRFRQRPMLEYLRSALTDY